MSAQVYNPQGLTVAAWKAQMEQQLKVSFFAKGLFLLRAIGRKMYVNNHLDAPRSCTLWPLGFVIFSHSRCIRQLAARAQPQMAVATKP